MLIRPARCFQKKRERRRPGGYGYQCPIEFECPFARKFHNPDHWSDQVNFPVTGRDAVSHVHRQVLARVWPATHKVAFVLLWTAPTGTVIGGGTPDTDQKDRLFAPQADTIGDDRLTKKPICNTLKLHLIVGDIGLDNQSRVKIRIINFCHGR